MLRISKNMAIDIMFELHAFKKSERAQELYKQLNALILIDDLKETRNKAYKRYKETGNENDKSIYVTLKNEIEKEQKEYEQRYNMR